jgi:DNA-binding NtrC family response regulator
MRFVAAALRDTMRTPRKPTDDERPPGRNVVLILSTDVVAAALVGALVETLGYLVRFFTPPETADEALRRTRPAVAMIDCEDPTLVNTELLGRARMRGISVLMFGTATAIQQVRDLAEEHELDAVIMPASLEELDESLRSAISKTC